MLLRRALTGLVIVVAVEGVFYAQRQAPPRDRLAASTGTARISGRVIASDTSRPVRLAQIQLLSPGAGPPRGTTTDVDGRYELTNLPAGRYTIRAIKGGYVAQEFGQRGPYDLPQTIELASGETRERIDFLLIRGGVITGRVVDDLGDGVTQARVEALRLEYTPGGGQRGVAAGTSGPTDDLGQFRVYGLPPGDYLVRATTTQGPMRIIQGSNVAREDYAPTYYPGTASASNAQPVVVNAGQETIVQFAMPTVRFAAVSGIIMDSQGRPFTSGQLELRPQSARIIPTRTMTAIRNGAFAFSNVAPGPYTLEFQSDYFRERNSSVELASVPLVVDGSDITGLIVTTSLGASVNGVLTFEGTPRPDATRITVNTVSLAPEATPRRPTWGPAPTSGDGRFQLQGLTGPLLFRPQVPAGWMLEAVRLEGRDITDIPYQFAGGENITSLEIVLTNRVTSVSGVVRDRRGEYVKDYSIVIMPDTLDPGASLNRFVRVARSDSEGRFVATSLPPAAYIAAAFESVAPGRQWDPRFQDVVRAAGKRFSVDKGTSITLNLEMTD